MDHPLSHTKPENFSKEQLAYFNQQLESWETSKILEWAIQLFASKIMISTSFGAESAVLLHLVTQIDPNIPVLFTDTGFHFPETLLHLNDLQKRLNLNLRILKPTLNTQDFLNQYGKLYETKPDQCCAMNKVEPFQTALQDYDAWITGVRRDQSHTRQKLVFVEIISNPNGWLTKICPLLNWNSKMLWDYAKKFDLPYHPLWSRGYLSIGCSPDCCTRPAQLGQDPRSGRWANKDKTECGIHTLPLSAQKE